MASTATEATPLRSGSASPSPCCGDTAFRVRVLTIVASLAEGYDLAVMANALVSIQKEFGLGSLMTGIFVSCMIFAVAFSSTLVPYFTDTFGRKPTIGLACALICTGNSCWAVAPNLIVAFIGRIVVGLGIGIGMPAVTMYMAEVAPVKQRGLYVGLEELFINVGMLSGFLFGALLVGIHNDWRIMVGIGALPALVSCIFAMTPYLPESPRYLQAAGRREEARQVLLDLLHGDEQEVNDAFERWAEEARNNQQSMGWSAAMSAFCSSHSRVAIAGIGAGLFFMLSGIAALTNYAVPILLMNGMSSKGAAFAMVCVGLVKTCSLVIPTFFLLDWWGRRPLLLYGGSTMMCACCCIAYANYASLGGICIVIGLCIFMLGFSGGIGPTYYVYVSEVFDNSTRAKGVTISFFFSRLTSAMITLWFPLMIESMGVTAVFCLFAGLNACSVIFYWTFCLETSGVPLERINEVFRVSQKQALKV